MSVACTSCGHAVPLGQFRCGKCGAAQTRDSIEDLDAPQEFSGEEPPPARDPGPDTGRHALLREDATEPVPRDSIIPRGTFASDEPTASDDAAAGQAVPAERGSNPPPRPAPSPVALEATTTAKPRLVSDAQVSQEPRLAQPAPKPPFLASEILREDLMPAEPGRAALTLALRGCGALGLLVALFSFGSPPFALISVGGLAMLAASSLRVPHLTRAVMVACIAGAGLTIAAFWRVALGGGSEDALLAVSAPLLASALLFRAWYRSSIAARALVSVGLLACVAWALMSANAKLLSLDWAWQSWLPALLWCVFVILCVLSLLAFMDDETTGACDVWSVCLLGWYLLNATAREALGAEAATNGDGLSTLGLTEPIFAAPLAVALAQLLARGLGRQQRLAQVLLRRNA